MTTRAPCEVRILQHVHCACFSHPHRVEPGEVVSVTPAWNQPQDSPVSIRFWVDRASAEECYGLGLRNGDFEVIA